MGFTALESSFVSIHHWYPSNRGINCLRTNYGLLLNVLHLNSYFNLGRIYASARRFSECRNRYNNRRIVVSEINADAVFLDARLSLLHHNCVTNVKCSYYAIQNLTVLLFSFFFFKRRKKWAKQASTCKCNYHAIQQVDAFTARNCFYSKGLSLKTRYFRNIPI